MKSIVEEASSLEKAIAKAWERAEKPEKFTVTIFQESQKNFFGLTKQSAKIGFLYQENTAGKNSKDKTSKVPKKNFKKEASFSAAKNNIAHARHEKEANNSKVELRKISADRKKELDVVAQPKKIFWPEEVVERSCKWLDDILKAIHSDSKYTVKTNRYHLKIQFEKSLFSDAKQEKDFFRALSYLILQAQRANFKKSFKFHKIVLLSANDQGQQRGQ